MPFLEIQFPSVISMGAMGGPGYRTDVVGLESGHEQRNQIWSVARGRWDVAHGLKSQADFDSLLAFFRVAKGKANGFRFKDWLDYSVTVTNGYLGSGVGTGLPTYQLNKLYTNAAGSETRTIKKPVASAFAPKRGGVAIAAGAGAGQYSLDSTTGIMTMVADASSNASSITPGATTQVVLAANPGTLTAGQLLYLTGFAGAHAADVNGLAHTINSVTGSGPYTFTLATNTNGRTITLGSGAGRKYPQASESMLWAGEFDVPARFDTDEMRATFQMIDQLDWPEIPVIEVRV